MAVLAYANSLDNGFALDDIRLVRDNPRLASLDKLPGLLTQPYWGPEGQQSGLYRPVTVISLSLNRTLTGSGAVGFHAVNVFLHALISALVWFIVRRHAPHYGTALFAALLFALHPLHTEAVANIAGRAELVAALAVCVAWLCHGAARDASSAPRRVAWSAAAGLGYLLALLSKESAVLAPLIFLLADRWRSEEPAKWRSRGWQAGVYFAVANVVVALRIYALNGWRGAQDVAFIDNPAAFAGAGARVATALWVQVKYALLFFWPARLSSDYSFDAIPVVDSPGDPRLWAGLLWIAALVALFVFGWRRSMTVAVGVAAWFLFLLPGSNLLFTAGTAMAERLLYLPVMGGSLVVAHLAAGAVARSKNRRRAATLVGAVALAILAAAGARTVARNPDWRDNLTLARHDALVAPRSAKLHAGVGIALHGAGNIDEAEPAYRRALEIYPDYAQVHYNLGELLLLRGRPVEAVEHLQRAAEISPANPRPWRTLGPLLEQAGEPERALQAYARAAELEPADFGLRFNQGRLLLVLGRTDEARQVLAGVARDDSTGVAGGVAAALLAETHGDFATAVGIYRRLLAVPGLPADLRSRIESRLDERLRSPGYAD